jgi:type VI secretion system secreted protein VgrG
MRDEVMMSERLSPVGYTLEFADGPDAVWQVFGLRVSEALDRPYDATLDAMTKAEGVDTEALLGADATLTIGREGGQLQHLYGVVVKIDYLGFADHHLCVRFHLAPAFRLLAQRIDSRIWQDASVADIVSEVLGPLGDYGRSFDPGSISRGAAVRDYCVQYRESDHDYVTRLLEEEGISYIFVHEAGAGYETLTLRDDNAQYPAIEGTPELAIILDNAEEAGAESIQRFEWSRTLTSTASLRRDFDWKQPDELLTTPADGEDERARVRRRYAHGDRRYIRDDQTQQSADSRKSAAGSGAVARGLSNATVLRPGLRFKIAEHERDDLVDREYIVTEVVHKGSCSDVTSLARDDLPRYANEFTCIPADVEIRPICRTPKPRVQGPQTAIVTGDGEIHTDADGRIQVQFHWEEKPSYAADSSCWIRCAQTWAGPGWGAQFIPRIGMEVVVEFLEGNPDRPLVIGCVYNGANPPPFALPDTKTQSGWRTNSSPGGGGFNELRFEDSAGSEEIYIHGQKDWRIEIGNDKSQTIGHDETHSVGNDQSNSIGHDQSSTIGNDQSLSVGHDQSNSIGHDQSSAIGHDQSSTIGNNQSLTIGNSQQIGIGVDCSETIGASHTQTIGAVKTVAVAQMYGLAVGAGYNIVVGAEMAQGVGGAMITTVGGVSTEVVIGDKSVTANDIQTTAKSDYALTVGKKLTATAVDDIGITGKKSGKIEFAKDLVLKCGDASITLKKNGNIVIKGKAINIKGSSDVKIKGSKVGNN